MVELMPLWTDYGVIALIVVGLSAALAVIVYAIGRALANEQLIAWSKNEIYQVFGSVIIVALTFFVYSMINGILLSILSSAGFSCDANGCSFNERVLPSMQLVEKTCGEEGNPCHIAVARSRLDGMYDLIRYYTSDKIVSVGTLNTLASFTISLGRGSIGLKISPLAGLDVVTDSIYDNAIEILIGILITLKAHWFFLEIISKAVFPLFLVGGIILRGTSFTRKVGGLMIAVAVVLYFIYPMMVIFVSFVISPSAEVYPLEFEQILEDVFPEMQSQAPENIGQFLNPMMIDLGGGKKVDKITYTIFRSVEPSYRNPNTGKLTPGGILDATAMIMVWFAAQQAIIAYAVVIAIKDLSPLFGGDVEIAGLSRLV